ncbi:MAG: hypothetical protein ACTSUE_01350 [Promethearchaeota archaeon]
MVTLARDAGNGVVRSPGNAATRGGSRGSSRIRGNSRARLQEGGVS